MKHSIQLKSIVIFSLLRAKYKSKINTFNCSNVAFPLSHLSLSLDNRSKISGHMGSVSLCINRTSFEGKIWINITHRGIFWWTWHTNKILIPSISINLSIFYFSWFTIRTGWIIFKWLFKKKENVYFSMTHAYWDHK